MDSETYGYLEDLWARELPDVPWPYDLTADPQAVATGMQTHLAVRHRRPPTVVTVGKPLVVEPRPCNAPRPDPEKTA